MNIDSMHGCLKIYSIGSIIRCVPSYLLALVHVTLLACESVNFVTSFSAEGGDGLVRRNSPIAALGETDSVRAVRLFVNISLCPFSFVCVR